MASTQGTSIQVAGARVLRLGVGTAPLAFSDCSTQQAVRTLHAAFATGVHLVDTALAYTRPDIASWSEQVVAQAVGSWPDPGQVLVATKGGHHRAGAHFPVDASPARLRADCESSLRSLGVDTLALYQLHKPDPAVPLLESVGALVQLQQEGKIQAIGISNVDLTQLRACREVADIAAVQNEMSWRRPGDLEVLEHCQRHGIAYLAHSPLGGRTPPPLPPERAHALQQVAQEAGCSPQRVQLAWLLTRSPALVPVVGATRAESIQDSAAAVITALSEDGLRRLSAPTIGTAAW